ncbi:MAG: Lactamase protein, partial [Patescibacteria group bacterium]|nr:Lactamase protein [Patescibacteria group bacterium]
MENNNNLNQEQSNQIRPPRPPQRGQNQNSRPKASTSGPLMSSRSRAIQASRRTQDDANKAITSYNVVEGRLKNDSAGPVKKDTLRIIFLGGMNGIGTHNFVVFEYNDDALVVDCGMDLTLGNLPGVNFGISDI